MRELILASSTTVLTVSTERVIPFVTKDRLDWEDFREVRYTTQYGHERIGFGETRRIGIYSEEDVMTVMIANGYAEVYLSFVPEDEGDHVQGPDALWLIDGIQVRYSKLVECSYYDSGDDFIKELTLGFCN